MPTSRIAAAVAATASLLGAACTGGDDDASSATKTQGSTSAVQAFDHDRPAPAEPIEGAVRGGTVTMLTSTPFERLPFFGPDGPDPTESYVWAPFMSAYVTRSLTQYAYDPEQDAMVVVPDIATDIGRPNADFTEWTYTIRDGVRFQDGTEVTAEDVAFGIKRSFDPSLGGPTWSSEFFLDGDTYGGPYVTGTSYRGVVVDGNDLTIKMADPFPDMPYWGTYPAMGPIPELRADPATYWKHPLATGPYMFEDDYTPGEPLTLVRNPEWDPDTDPGRHPYPDRVIARFGVPTAQLEHTILGDSSAGRTTFTTDQTTLEDPAYDAARRLGRVATGSQSCTRWWSPDNRKITDIRVRRAIGYAYPYEAAAEALGVPRSTLPSQTLLPPGFPGRRDYRALDIEPGDTDPAAARALLDEARQAGVDPEQFVLRWAYDKDDPLIVDRATLVSAALERVGFTAKFLPVSAETADSFNHDRRAPVNLRGGGWCGDWMSGSTWLPEVLHSHRYGNVAYFSEPEVDEAIEAVSTLPIDQQPAEWGALDERIMTEYYPLIALGGRTVGLLHGADIAGMHVDPANSGFSAPTYKDLYVIR